MELFECTTWDHHCTLRRVTGPVLRKVQAMGEVQKNHAVDENLGSEAYPIRVANPNPNP